MATDLKQFLTDLSTDPLKLGEFLHDPETAMKTAEISEDDKAALRSGIAGMIAARLAGVPLDKAFQPAPGAPQILVQSQFHFVVQPPNFVLPPHFVVQQFHFVTPPPPHLVAQQPLQFHFVMPPPPPVFHFVVPPPPPVFHFVVPPPPPHFVVQQPPHFVVPPQFVVQQPPHFVVPPQFVVQQPPHFVVPPQFVVQPPPFQTQ